MPVSALKIISFTTTSSKLTDDLFQDFNVFVIPAKHLPMNMSEEALLMRAHYTLPRELRPRMTPNDATK